jgi:hypothetical protein
MTHSEAAESLTYARAGLTSTPHVVQADDPKRTHCGRRVKWVTTNAYGPVCKRCASRC